MRPILWTVRFPYISNVRMKISQSISRRFIINPNTTAGTRAPLTSPSQLNVLDPLTTTATSTTKVAAKPLEKHQKAVAPAKHQSMRAAFGARRNTAKILLKSPETIRDTESIPKLELSLEIDVRLDSAPLHTIDWTREP